MTWNKILSIIAAAGGFIAGLFGEWTVAMTTLLYVMAADYVLGCICGFFGKSTKTDGGRWLSSVAFKGLLNKGLEMLVVLVATQLDKVVTTGSSTFQTMAVFYYISCEGLSCFENLGILGIPLPAFLKKALEVMKQENDKDESQNEQIGSGNKDE